VVFKPLTMFSWLNKDDRRKGEPEVYASVAEGLKKLYQQVHYTCCPCFALLMISLMLADSRLESIILLSVFSILQCNFELHVK